MSRPETLSAPESVEGGARPELSVVVTLFDEVATLDELQRRLTETLAAFGRAYEILYVDDGSTDGTFAALERIHAGDAHVRAVRLKRNSGQHPAMHAGLSRARGAILVTMDGDLQNPPEDVPALVEAVEAGYDVASGRPRRAARLLGEDAAVAADQRHAAPLHRRRHLRLRLRVQRVPARGGRADARRDRPAEVHEGARPLGRRVRRGGRRRPRAARGRLALLAAPADALALHVLAGFWPQPIQTAGVVLGLLCSLASLALGLYGVVYWIGEEDFPGPLLLGALVVAVLGVQGFILALVGEYLGRIQRIVEHRPLYLVDREL